MKTKYFSNESIMAMKPLPYAAFCYVYGEYTHRKNSRLYMILFNVLRKIGYFNYKYKKDEE